MYIYGVILTYSHPDGEGWGTEYEYDVIGYFSKEENAKEFLEGKPSKKAQSLADEEAWGNEDVELSIVKYELDGVYDTYRAMGKTTYMKKFEVSELQQKWNEMSNEKPYGDPELEDLRKQLLELHGEEDEEDDEDIVEREYNEWLESQKENEA